MEEDIWLKRWNTLKNRIQWEMKEEGLDNPTYGTLLQIHRIMEAIEELEDDVSE